DELRGGQAGGELVERRLRVSRGDAADEVAARVPQLAVRAGGDSADVPLEARLPAVRYAEAERGGTGRRRCRPREGLEDRRPDVAVRPDGDRRRPGARLPRAVANVATHRRQT